MPVRRVVSYIKAPFYKPCKHINNLLPNVIDCFYKYNIKNSLVLIDKLNHKKLELRSMFISCRSILFTR